MFALSQIEPVPQSNHRMKWNRDVVGLHMKQTSTGQLLFMQVNFFILIRWSLNSFISICF